MNGSSVVDFQDRSRKENVTSFIREIRERNPEKPVAIILDNFRSHHSKTVLEAAEYQADIPSTVFSRSESNRIHMEECEEGGINSTCIL